MKGKARLPGNSRRASDSDEKSSSVEIKVRLDVDQAQQLHKIASAANLQVSKAVARLLAFALEKLLQQQKQRESTHW